MALGFVRFGGESRPARWIELVEISRRYPGKERRDLREPLGSELLKEKTILCRHITIMEGINQSSKFYFDNPEIFKRVHHVRFKPESDFVRSLLSQQASVANILDVACGTGAHASLLTEAGFTVTGLDLNPFMIKFAHKNHPTLAFLLGDMRALPFSNAFDALICMCSSFSYNNSNEEVTAALQGFSRALKSGGLAIIDVFNPLSLLEKRAFASEIREDTKYAQVGMYSVREI